MLVHRPSAAEYKLYVSMLSHATTEDEVRRMFEHFGPLSEVVVLRSKDEQALSKGSAFVKFQTKEAADLAIATMNQKVKDKVRATHAQTGGQRTNNRS